MDERTWAALRQHFSAAFASTLHCSIASVDASGAPLVTPIGSVLLGEAPGHAFYFEVFAAGLGARLARDPRVSVLAVNASRWFWVRSLLRGSFDAWPAIRLTGHASVSPRPATERECARMQRRLGVLRSFPGGRMLWSRLEQVRDLHVERVDRLPLGPMTRAVSA